MEKNVLETVLPFSFHNCGIRQIHPKENIVNSDYLLHFYSMPGTALNVFNILSHLILITNVENRCNQSRCIDEEIEV